MDFLRTSVSCWREGFTFKFCCTRALAGGEPSCWDGHSFTYERCCRPPLPSEASAVFEDVNCHRVPGHTDWQRLREELVVLSNSLEGGRFGEDFGQEGGRGLLRRLSRSFPRSLDCGVGRLALAVAQALLCILSGGDGCQKYWDHLAQAFRGDALDVVRMSATEWPVMELLLHLSRVAAALRQLYSEACQEVEGALDWPLLFQSAQDPNNAELAHKVLRMSFGDAAGAGALLGSGCRGGAQWLALNKLSFCMDMAPECVKSYTLVLQVFARRAASDGRALQSWMEEAGTWRLYDLHQGMVQNRVRHRFQLGLSRLELQHLGVLSPKAVVGCLRLKAAFSEASDELAYFLLDPEPGLTPFAAERCRALCGQTGRQWRSYGVLPEVTEGAMRGFPCACSAIDEAAGNCTPKEAPLFAMPRRSLGPPETAERSEVLGQAARVLDSLDGSVPVFVTMVFGKMSKSLGIPNVVVFVLDDPASAGWAHPLDAAPHSRTMLGFTRSVSGRLSLEPWGGFRGVDSPMRGGEWGASVGASSAPRAPPLAQLRTCSQAAAVTALSEDEEMLRDSAQRFAAEVLAPKVQEMDHKAAMPKEVVDALFEQGLMGIEVPAEHGGVGLGFAAACLAIEEVAKVDPAVSALMDIHNTLLVTAFKRYASKELQEEFLPRLATDTVGAFCLSEPNSGSDAFALKTKAVQDGSDWVIEGGKCWISNSLEAGAFVVFANADPSKAHRGITAFVVEKGNPGLQIGKKEDKLGIRASSTCELVFEKCRVPKTAVLGEVGQGYKIAMELLNEGRIGIGAQMVGLAQGAFDYALRYMVTRKQFGQSIADFQGMQFQYARAAMEIQAARVLVFNAARLKESGQPFLQEAAMAKLKASEVAQDVSSQCIDWLGGVGFTKEFLAEKYYRDAKIGTIYEGTSNIQLQTIAKSIRAAYSE
ncbi:unnamed protein product [Effrenium voratum]|nr:unnamed protein product [Effrenium voratum]